MSKVIACKNQNGIIPAADSQAVDFDLKAKWLNSV